MLQLQQVNQAHQRSTWCGANLALRHISACDYMICLSAMLLQAVFASVTSSPWLQARQPLHSVA